MERFAFSQLAIKRLEIVTLKANTASKRVAEKCSYRREGIQRGKLIQDGKYCDGYLFGKIRETEHLPKRHKLC